MKTPVLQLFAVYDREGVLRYAGEDEPTAITAWKDNPGSDLVRFEPQAQRVVPPGYHPHSWADSRWVEVRPQRYQEDFEGGTA